jgi:hypothetical protein
VSLWFKAIAALSFTLSLWIIVNPYLAASSKTGSGWGNWPDYTRSMVAEEMLATALPATVAFLAVLLLYRRNQAPWLCYMLVLLAPMLCLLAYAMAMHFQ